MKKVVVMVLAAGVLMTPPVKADPVSQELWRARAESVHNKTWAEFDYKNYKARMKASRELAKRARLASEAYNSYDLATTRVIASEARVTKYGIHYYGLDSNTGDTKARLK